MNTKQFYAQAASGIADLIFQELGLHPGKGHYQVKRPNNLPRVLILPIAINPTYARKLMGMQTQLSMAAKLNRDDTIQIRRGSNGTLLLEIPKPGNAEFDLPISKLRHRTGLKTVIGVDTEFKSSWLDFDTPTGKHALIAGTSGAGKTNVQRLIAYDLAMQNDPANVQMLLLDISDKQGLGWRGFESLPHLAHPIITDRQDAYKLFGWLSANIRKRVHHNDFLPHIFVGIEEIQDLMSDKELSETVSSLVRIGREVNIHFLASTQHLTVKNLGGSDIKRNITQRLIGKTDDATSANVAAGVTNSGAQFLTGEGDMILVSGGKTRRLAIALVSDKDIERLPMSDTQNKLDLDSYEDLRHIESQADIKRIGRNLDDIEPVHLAYALEHPESSQRQVYEEFSIGFPKIKKIQEYAQALLEIMANDGYSICKVRG
jgi:DNA segregation ATPase FtsK/SpoIIIE-like protein